MFSTEAAYDDVDASSAAAAAAELLLRDLRLSINQFMSERASELNEIRRRVWSKMDTCRHAGVNNFPYFHQDIEQRKCTISDSDDAFSVKSAVRVLSKTPKGMKTERRMILLILYWKICSC